MSRVTGIPHSKPLHEYHEVPQHDGRMLDVYVTSSEEAAREGLPVEPFVLVCGYLEKASSVAPLAQRMVSRAYAEHGRQLQVVTYNPPEVRSQASHNQAFMAVAVDAWERHGCQPVNVGGHSRGGRTAIEGSLRLGRLGMIKDVWGITPAGFSVVWPSINPRDIAANGLAICRELVGDAGIILRRPKTIIQLGNMAMHAAEYVVGDLPGSLREAHELSTQLIAAEAAELWAKHLVQRVGLIVGRDDGVCLPGRIGKNLDEHAFGGQVVEVPTTHLGPLVDPHVAHVLTDVLLNPQYLPEAPRAA